MNLRVLRPADGKMMKLVKYTLDEGEAAVEESVEADIIHNHELADPDGSDDVEG